MRRFRAFAVLAEGQLKQKSFWIFLIMVVLIGPVFVVLHSETNLSEREMRPLLSESATIDHFDIGVSATGYIGRFRKSAILLFRNPDSESAPEFPISPAFVAGRRLLPPVSRTVHSTWSFPLTGSLSDFYRNLLPILMTVAGILAFPSRRRLALLRVLLPCGRWGCFLMMAAVLVLQITMIGILAGASTGLALGLTQGPASGTSWFVSEYFAAIIVYGIGFALLGFVVVELVRNRAVALLIGLILLVGVWEYAAPMSAKLYTSLVQSVTGKTLLEPGQNPVFGYIGFLLLPPQNTFDSIGLTIQKLTSGVEDPYTPRSTVLRELAQLWARLVAFAGFWFAIGWIAFPRSARMIS
ncbi:hypothetical protein KAJ02_12735 [Candidatus Bipolaricaulota bacterium]|nr:hypothetical protein [Candidatus Bipolaricaulota bacterium]